MEISKGKNFTHMIIGPFEKLLDEEFRGLRGKFFAGKELGLTSCEVSLNRLPAGQAMPFTHAHKQNEELYIITAGSGTFYVDGNEFPVHEGSLIRVAPSGERSWKADEEDLYFICIQAKEGSLTQATLQDGMRLEARASWMIK